ncbi:hypothetical protein Tco_0135205 [Tanacetum coccineum]
MPCFGNDLYQGVTAALAARDADKNTNGDDIHISGAGLRRTERTARECTYTDFLKCQPLNFKGTEGVAGLILQGLVKRNNMGDLNPYAQNKTITTMVHVLPDATSVIKSTCYECGVQGHCKRGISKKAEKNTTTVVTKLEVAMLQPKCMR